MISALNKLADGTVELTITIPWKRVSESYQKVLTAMAAKTEVKGFRKGKAPIKLVEGKFGKTAVYEEVLKDLIPAVYSETIKEQKIYPIVSPQIKVISLEENKDWQIQATTCELPTAELGDYKSEIRKAIASEKIWVPGKDKAKDTENAGSQDQKMQKIFTALLQTAKVNLPAILVNSEVDRLLSRLIDQTSKLGLTVEQYLSSSGKTSDQIKAEYRQQAEEALKLEIILGTIANDQKVEIKDEEIEKMISEVKDEKTKENLKTPTEKVYLRQLLRKRAVIDNLMKL